MGRMIDGQWVSDASVIERHNGRFVRESSRFRRFVTRDADGEFPAAPGRYHLYVSLQCPWAWRAVVYRSVKALEDVVGMSIAIPDDRRDGWRFGEDVPGSSVDEAEGFTHLHRAYAASMPDYTGIVSVPVLWDKRTRQIVNNESSDIVRMLNDAFDDYTERQQDYYPAHLRQEIDRKNKRLYAGLNNAVYRAGAASSQAAYEEGCHAVFDTLDWAEAILSESRYLNGAEITESDWKLAATLFRFDPVYHPLFRCNKRRLAEYPNLSNYLRDIYQTPGVAQTVNVRHIVLGYYSHLWNPSRIIPLGPEYYEEWLATPHDRASPAAAPPR